MIAGSKTMPPPEVQAGLDVRPRSVEGLVQEGRNVLEDLEDPEGLDVLPRLMEGLVQEGRNVLEDLEDPEGLGVLPRLMEGLGALQRLVEGPNVRRLTEGLVGREGLMVWRVPAAVIEYGHRGVHMHWRVDKGLDEEDRGPADPERYAADIIQAVLAAEDFVASLAGGTPDTGRGVQQVAGHAVDMLGPADNARSTRGCRCSHSICTDR